jgi:uncharacterized membrane protein YhiD involved in acid resistance
MDTITSKDIFTNSFVAMQGATSSSSIMQIIISLFISFLIGFFIFFIYKKTFQGVLYQRSFNVSLIVITMVLTFIIMIIKGNLVLSLGMVGALSIVRFRTPVKDPMDLVFIFWAIAVGIANGVSFFHISIIGSIMITIVLLIMSKRKISNDSPYLLIIKMKKDSDSQEVSKKVNNLVKVNYLKSKTITAEYSEIIYEVRISDSNTQFMSNLQKSSDVLQATLITYSGDMAST